MRDLTEWLDDDINPFWVVIWRHLVLMVAIVAIIITGIFMMGATAVILVEFYLGIWDSLGLPTSGEASDG